MAEDFPRWSPEEERLLHHEGFMAEALRIRRGQDTNNRPKPPWLVFFNPAVVVALITVIFGSIGAGVLNSLVQAKLKERELAVAAYQEQLKQRHEIVRRTYELVMDCITASEDLIFLTMSEFDPRRFVGEGRQTIIAQRTETRKKYNVVDTQWRVDGQKVALLIGLYGDDQGSASEAWAKVQQAVTGYKNCAEDWYYQHEEYVSLETARSACKDEKKQIVPELQQFTRQIQGALRKASPSSGTFW